MKKIFSGIFFSPISFSRSFCEGQTNNTRLIHNTQLLRLVRRPWCDHWWFKEEIWDTAENPAPLISNIQYYASFFLHQNLTISCRTTDKQERTIADACRKTLITVYLRRLYFPSALTVIAANCPDDSAWASLTRWRLSADVLLSSFCLDYRHSKSPRLHESCSTDCEIWNMKYEKWKLPASPVSLSFQTESAEEVLEKNSMYMHKHFCRNWFLGINPSFFFFYCASFIIWYFSSPQIFWCKSGRIWGKILWWLNWIKHIVEHHFHRLIKYKSSLSCRIFRRNVLFRLCVWHNCHVFPFEQFFVVALIEF